MLKKSIHYSLFFLASTIFSCKPGQTTQQSATPVQLEERLDKIKMTDLKGKPFSLHKLAGKPILLNFWATWCKPCISEMNSMEQVYQQYKNDITFLAVSTEPLDKIKDFKAKQNLSFEFAQLNIEYIDAYVITLPTSFLINAGGQLVSEEEGIRIWTQYNNLEKVKALVKKP